jgi:apolipoprotein D and lipocalin family protein
MASGVKTPRLSAAVGQLLLTTALACAAVACSSDPPLDVASNVDLSRFQGKWYEIARLPRTTQTDCHGTTAFYTQGSDGALTFVNQCNVGGATGPLKTVSMSAKVPDQGVPAKLALDVGGYTGDYWILEVGSNYEYAVVGHPSRLYFWILSRTPTLDPTTMQGVLGRAQSNHFDTTQIQYTPQPPPDDRASSDAPVGDVPPALQTGCSASAPRSSTGQGWALALVVAALATRGHRRARRIPSARRTVDEFAAGAGQPEES